MTAKAPKKQPSALRKNLHALYVAFVDYLARTISKAKPGTVPPGVLAVVRLVCNDAGITRELRTLREAQKALAGLKGEASALSLPFNAPDTKQ